TAIAIDGGLAPTGDTLNFDAANLAARVIAGSLLAAGRQPVLFTNIEKLNIDNAAALGSVYGPNTAARAAALAGRHAPQRSAQGLYLKGLRRAGSMTELNGWVSLYNSTAGSQAQKQFVVANGIERSAEARTRLAKSWYLQYLGRAAVGGEEQVWVNVMLQ